MRVPLSWLREFVPVAEDASAEDLMATLVKVGLEEEDVHRPSDELSGPIVVGQVLSMEPETHSNGKTVNWCQVRVVPEGQEQTLTGKGIEPSGVQGIICGAHNFKPGDKVVVTLPGAVLPGGFAITARKTYGHKSAGMIASTRELGIGDDRGGILVLSTLGLDPELGTDAMELLGLYDQAAEVNVTPDRGYAFSCAVLLASGATLPVLPLRILCWRTAIAPRRLTTPVTRLFWVMTPRFTVTPHALVS